MTGPLPRRGVLAGLAALVVAGCSRIAASGPGASLLGAVEGWNRGLHDWLGRRTSLAREFSLEDISRAALPFIAVMILDVLLLTYIPALSTVLPKLMGLY